MKKKLLSFHLKTITTAIILAFCYWLYFSSQTELLNYNLKTSFTYKWISLFSIYISLITITGYLSFLKLFKLIQEILLLPLFLSLIIFPIITSFYRMFIGSLTVFMLTFFLLKEGLPLIDINLIPSTLLYCCFTFTIVVYSLLGDRISYWVISIMDSEKLEESERYKDVFDQNKFSYLIYVLAFICLIFFSICDLNNIQIAKETKILKSALLPSFATFVAWDRLLSKKIYLNLKEY